jgi:hypothetical protein
MRNFKLSAIKTIKGWHNINLLLSPVAAMNKETFSLINSSRKINVYLDYCSKQKIILTKTLLIKIT